tara:strand:- start:24696 stop:24863 length:168 start_codon:yes stop_codon:yes gene_type:complete
MKDCFKPTFEEQLCGRCKENPEQRQIEVGRHMTFVILGWGLFFIGIFVLEYYDIL